MGFFDEVVPTPQGSAVPTQTVALAGNATLSVTADGIEIKNDSGNPVPVNGLVTADSNRGNVSNGSATIATGGTSQQVFGANGARKYLLVQNVSDTDMNLGIGYAPTATTGILLNKNGGAIVFEGAYLPTQPINILCATTGKAFVAIQDS